VINGQQAAPPELVASVLLAEMSHYNVIDDLGDWTPGNHSVGIAQIRVDTVRRHATARPDIYGPIADMDDESIGALLWEPTTAIQVLALEIKYLSAKAGIKDINAAWDNSNEANRRLMVEAATSAKDTDSFIYINLTSFAQWGTWAYDQIRQDNLLK
jgi:hypothetical protein